MSNTPQEKTGVLYRIWHSTFRHLSRLDYFQLQQMSIHYRDLRIFQYICYAVRCAAPLSTLFLFFSSALSVSLSIYLSFIMGDITESVSIQAYDEIKMLGVVMLLVWISIPAVQMISFLSNMFVSQNLRGAIIDHLSARITFAEKRALEKNHLGNLVERIEVASVSLPGVVSALSDTLIKLFSVLILVSVLLTDVSVELAISVALWITSAIILSAYLAYSGMKFVENASDTHSKLMSEMTEVIMNIPVISAFLSNQYERKRLNKYLSQDIEACRQVRTYWLLVQSIETAYKWLFGFLFIFYSFYQFESGVFTLAQLVTLLTLIIILSWHFESVAFHFVDFFDSLGELNASLKDIRRIPISVTEIEPIDKPESFSISLKNIFFVEDGKIILNDVNLDIQSGSKVAIVGFSGSGKSTLLKIISGQMKPTHGDVLISSDVHFDDSWNAIKSISSFSDQNAPLFNRTVKENITYSSHTANDEKIKQVISESESFSIIERLSDGLNTVIEEQGTSVSTGEKQRISIARALYKESSVLFFDEATSSVDIKTEARIIRNLLKDPQQRTLLFVTHRVASVKEFDQIVVVSHGKIISCGTHDELMTSCHLYVSMQTEKSFDNDEKDLKVG
ncbi:hypothetical protein EA58_13320 [Photobacterium galatheae]|uniref:ABC transporter ATP-binding protein n=1 Tax=Photobacterium galatheae TaxID=1654360 RepID=A0A066RL14_9GAMM|nr:ABC transporter ATP-binding protein [Photobacterium galatheae]KDM91125.1 hypothetical protein EA58_13320 [Photobacterium galatheae]